MSQSELCLHKIFLDAQPRLHRFLTQRMHCPETASDLLQEIYLRLPQLDPLPDTAAEVHAWLYRVAANLSIDYIRSQQRHTSLLKIYGGGEDEAIDQAATPDRAALACEELQQVKTALSELPERCSEVLYLSRIEGLTHADIARKLSISKSLVEKLVVRALNHCRQAIKDAD